MLDVQWVTLLPLCDSYPAMKKLPIIASLFLLLICNAFIHAQQLGGTEIDYQILDSSGTIQVRLTLYKECSAQWDSTSSLVLTIFKINTNSTYQHIDTFPVFLQQKSTVPLDEFCNTGGFCDSAASLYSGRKVNRYVYTGRKSLSFLPSEVCLISIAYQDCCRRKLSNTLGNDSMFAEVKLNRCLAIPRLNHAPRFCADPTFIINQRSTESVHTAVDQEHDSVSYRIIAPKSTHNSFLTYKPPFSFNRPFLWTLNPNSPFKLNTLTGELTILTAPDSVDFFSTYALEVTEWAILNGQPHFLSSVVRELTMGVSARMPLNNAPSVQLPPFPTYVIPTLVAHEGDSLCFTILVKDTDDVPGQYVNVNWDTSNTAVKLGATFTLNVTNPSILEFCWTPPLGAASNNPYTLPLYLKDQYCPISATAERVIPILVKPALTKKITQTLMGCGYHLSLVDDVSHYHSTITVGKVASDFSFSEGADSFINTAAFTLTNRAPGKYLMRVTLHPILGNSTIGWTDTLIIPQIQPIRIQYQQPCQTGSIVHADVNIDSLHSPVTLKWFLNGTSLISDTNASSVTFRSPKKATLKVVLSDGCKNELSDSIFIQSAIPEYQLQTTPVRCTLGKTGTAEVIIPNANSFTYQLNGRPLQNSNRFDSLGAGTYRILIRKDASCMIEDSVIVPVIPFLSGEITGKNASSINGIESYTYNSIEDYDSIVWSASGGTIMPTVQKDSILVQWENFGVHPLLLRVHFDGSCSDSIVRMIHVSPRTGLPAMELHSSLPPYPNPSRNQLYIDPSQVNMVCSFTDVNGRIVLKSTIDNSGVIDIKELPEGIYFVQIGTTSYKIQKIE